MKKATNLQYLKSLLNDNFISDKQAGLILTLFGGGFDGLSDRAKYVFGEDVGKVDYAVPQNIYDAIIKNMDADQRPDLMFSYINQSFGQLVNLDRLFMIRLLKDFEER